MARSIAVGATGSGRSRGLLVLAILFGLLSFGLAFVFLQSQTGSSDSGRSVLETSIASEEVVVAASDISPGDRITRDMIEVVTVPGAALQLDRFNNPELVVGLTATTLILAGEQIRGPKVTAFEGLDVLSARIPDGVSENRLRGLALTVPHESWIVGGLVQPGDRVDIIGITTLAELDELTGEERISLKTGIIAENIEVLAVSQVITKKIPKLASLTEPVPGAIGGEAGEPGTVVGEDTAGGVVTNEGTFQEALSVTLALDPRDAAIVALVDALDPRDGQWRLIVRQRGDTTPVIGELTWDFGDIFR